MGSPCSPLLSLWWAVDTARSVNKRFWCILFCSRRSGDPPVGIYEFTCSTPYCGFWENLLEPSAWTGDTHIVYDIVTDLILFDDMDEMKNSGIVLVQLILSDWGDQLLCDKMLRHYEDNAFIILTSVSECDWHQVCQLCEPDVLFWTLNFITVKLFIDLSSGMWVGDCSGRYMTTEQLYWSQLTLRMSNRTFYSPSWLEAERCRSYATSWLGDETTCFWECLFACQRMTHTLSLVLFLRSWIL